MFSVFFEQHFENVGGFCGDWMSCEDLIMYEHDPVRRYGNSRPPSIYGLRSIPTWRLHISEVLFGNHNEIVQLHSLLPFRAIEF